MGRIWTVSGMARAGIWPLLSLTLISACSNANLGWNYFAGYVPPNSPPLRVSGPVFVTVGVCSPFNVGFAGSSGAYTSSVVNLALQLSGSGLPTYYADPGCTQPISQTLLPKGALSQAFYVRNSQLGVQQVQVSNPSLPPVSRLYEVDGGTPVSIKVSGPASFKAKACVPYTFTFVDAGGNPAVFSTNVSLALSITGGAGIYPSYDPFCQTLQGFPYQVAAGTSSATFYITNTTTTGPMSMVLSASQPFAISSLASLTSTIPAATPNQVVLYNSSTPLQTGFCESISAYPADADGNAVVGTGATNITFSLVGPSSVTFWGATDSTCSTCVTGCSAATANPNSAAQIYFKDPVREKPRIKASATGLVDGYMDLDFANRATQATAGDSHSCMLRKDGLVYCFGSNEHGQLGTSNIGTLAVPLSGTSPVPLASPLPNATAVAAGPNHTCAIAKAATTQKVYCWGSNSRGQLGPGPAVGSDYFTPNVALTATSFSAVASGNAHSCAIDTTTANNNKLWCWGDNTNGQIGDSATYHNGYSSTPINVPLGGFSPAWVSAAGNTTCIGDFTGILKCFGSNAWGQLQTFPGADTLASVSLSTTAQASGLGRYHACQVDNTTYALSCWGRNLYGELGAALGLGTSTPIFSPVNTPIARPALGGPWIVGGDGFTCVPLSEGGILCFGRNDSGQLGNGGTLSFEQATLLPITVGPGSSVPSLAAGRAHVCTAQFDGTLTCWGLNDHGQLGVDPASQPMSSNPLSPAF